MEQTSATSRSTGSTCRWATSPTFSTTGTALDLTIGSGITTGSGNWISNTGGDGGTDSNYSNSANWVPASGTNQYPSGPGQVATFGSGSQATVTLSSTYTVGQLIFNGVGTASTTLGGMGGLLLNNSGNGPDVTVSAGAVYPYINVPLTLDDGSGKTTTFTVGAGSYLTMFGAIGETASSAQKILVTGGGTLELDGANTYTGSTTISAGTLLIDAGASIKSSSMSVAAGATLQLAGTTGALPSTANITTHGTGGTGDGAVTLTGTATETVGVISGTTGKRQRHDVCRQHDRRRRHERRQSDRNADPAKHADDQRRLDGDDRARPAAASRRTQSPRAPAVATSDAATQHRDRRRRFQQRSVHGHSSGDRLGLDQQREGPAA